MLWPLACAAVLVPGAASSQEAKSPSQNTAAVAPQDATEADLPVSLEHIRERLKNGPDQSLLRNVDIPPDFRIRIEEQQRLNDMLSKLDFKSGPAPAGGLYGYEQQRRLFSPTQSPLMQPYAAFSGGELITIALENLLARYLGGRVLSAMTSAEHARAEHAARQEVDREIAAYCATRPDRADIRICTSSTGEP